MIQKLSHISDEEMYRVFNMGIGFIIIVDKNVVRGILKILSKYSFKCQVIGKVVSGNRKVIFNDQINCKKTE